MFSHRIVCFFLLSHLLALLVSLNLSDMCRVPYGSVNLFPFLIPCRGSGERQHRARVRQEPQQGVRETRDRCQGINTHQQYVGVVHQGWIGQNSRSEAQVYPTNLYQPILYLLIYFLYDELSIANRQFLSPFECGLFLTFSETPRRRLTSRRPYRISSRSRLTR